MKLTIFRLLSFAAIPLLSPSLQAQTFLGGNILQSNGNAPQQSVRIKVAPLNGDTVYRTQTREGGRFRILLTEPGTYVINASLPGVEMEEWDSTVQISAPGLFLPNIRLQRMAASLDSVRIRARQGAVQKGDTTEYSASNYRVNRDADAETLIRKMPGITTENGQVKAQGENVQRVTVDGKEFFGDDVNTALRSLPAEIVGRVQVFDRMSDQSFFTGFDDGNSQKAINISTRAGRNNGVFGKVYAGYGRDAAEGRYQSGAVINWFKGIHRITFLGMSNNINQQNFSSQDLVGLGGSGGGFSGMRGMPPGMRGMRPGGWGGGGMSNFSVGPSNGISNTNSAGLNYSTTLGTKVNLSTSYFFNRSVNTTENLTLRDYFSQRGAAQLYNDSTLTQSTSNNHRLNVRLEYVMDSMNSFIYTNRLSYQTSEQESRTSAFNDLRIPDNGTLRLNSAETRSNSIGDGLNLSHSLLYKRRFNKPWRTFSLNLSQDENTKTSDAYLRSLNRYYESPDTTIGIDQLTASKSSGSTYSANFTYTEPSGKNGQWQVSYEPKLTRNYSERFARAYDSGSASYRRLDTLLSNRFTNTFLTQRTGLVYRQRGTNFNAMLGFNLQWTELKGEQDFPFNSNIRQPFFNVLPTAMYQYRINQRSNVRFFYRTSTNLPSASQLQEVVDNSNPLLLNVGNKNLVQDFSQFMVGRYGWSKATTGESIFAFVMHNRANNYIANSTFIAQADTVLDGIRVLRGGQLNRPVNMDGYRVVRSFFSYGVPIKKLKSNFNGNGGVSYTRVPGLVNGLANFANTWNLNAGAVLSSNINEQVDFTLSYSANYNLVTNTVRVDQNNNYLQQTGSARGNLQRKSGWVFSTELSYTGFSGLDADFRQNFLLWNAGIGYKFLKDQKGEFRLTAFDLLGQNNSLNRSVTETYVEDVQTRVLQRYIMLNFTYNIRKFKRPAGMPGGGMNPMMVPGGSGAPR